MITTFIRKLWLDARHSPEFFFNRVITANGVHFHVSVLDKEGTFYHFTMAEKNRQWKIVNAPQPPQWIIALEAELDKVICQNMLS